VVSFAVIDDIPIHYHNGRGVPWTEDAKNILIMECIKSLGKLEDMRSLFARCRHGVPLISITRMRAKYMNKPW
jgi:hypothetical protein